MKRICGHIGCNELIDYNKRYCSRHEVRYIKQRHEDYKAYDKRRLDVDKDVVEFYKTQDWLRVRDDVRRQSLYMDLYEYYTTGRIVEGYTVHHIVEVKENWNYRLDKHNLIYLSDSNHKHIHKLYNIDKQTKEYTQKLLLNYLKKFHDEFLHV